MNNFQKKDIETREDVLAIVRSFYSKVRDEKTLGPIFNQMIQNWEEHFETLTDFWETNLFGYIKYKGNPIAVHRQVDRSFQEKITDKHFGIWLNLWFATLDELHTGERVEITKRRARKMATHLMIRIHEDRVSQKTICPFLKDENKNLFK